MKTLLLSLVTILAGIAIGVGIASYRNQMSPWHSPESEHQSDTAKTAGPEQPTPKVVIEESRFDFGALDFSSECSHDFVFKNGGNAPLILTVGQSSCRCTTSSLPEHPITPGESGKVTITWKPIEQPGPSEQTVQILTNDPRQKQVTLTISGQVTMAMRFIPRELIFTRMAAGEPSTAEAMLLGYLSEPVKILTHRWENEATAKFFDVAIEPLSEEAFQSDASVKSGLLFKVTVKPGLPQGPFRQVLECDTNCATSPKTWLQIRGGIASDISIVGPNWDSSLEVLDLGMIDRHSGVQHKLMILVRGAERKNITFKQFSVMPDSLHVSFGEPTEMNNGLITQTPLFIEIPKGSPPMTHLGSEQGKLGEILLETTHPDVPKLRILVRFAIEG